MQYNQPYGLSDPNAPYVNGNPSVGLMGSIPPAASIEYPQRELVNFMHNTGLITPSNSDLNQLSKSVMTGMMHYGVDAGVKNALQVNLLPAPDLYYDGMFLFVVAAFTNDGPCTIACNSLGPVNIIRRGGGAVQAGDIPAGFKSLLLYNKHNNNFELYGVNFAAASGFIPVMLANTTWYVNGSIGSDTLYDGSQATISGSHGPFKTIMKAVNTIYVYGPSVYTATVQIAAGTYPETVASPGYPGPSVHFIGAGFNSTWVASPNSSCFACGGANTWIVEQIGVIPPNTSNVSGFGAGTGATLYTKNTASSGYTPGNIWEAAQGNIQIVGNHNFKAGSVVGCIWAGFVGGMVAIQGGLNFIWEGSMSVIGNTFSAMALSAGQIIVNPGPSYAGMINAGYVNAAKFVCSLNGVIYTQGVGVNYFPGNSPGTTNYGGQYL